jgi:hypothetical protein
MGSAFLRIISIIIYYRDFIVSSFKIWDMTVEYDNESPCLAIVVDRLHSIGTTDKNVAGRVREFASQGVWKECISVGYMPSLVSEVNEQCIEHVLLHYKVPPL